MTLNTTGSQAWSSPSNILSGDKSANGSIALAVCANTSASGTNLNTLNGLRVYYGKPKISIVRRLFADLCWQDLRTMVVFKRLAMILIKQTPATSTQVGLCSAT